MVDEAVPAPAAEPAQAQAKRPPQGGTRSGGLLRALGLGLISGAADDDPSAIGAYAQAGAVVGTRFLWVAPAILPMMYVAVYLCSKLGQVSGRGLFHVIRDFYPRWLMFAVLAGVLFGNIIEAAADLGGMAAGLNLFLPAPIPIIVAGTAVGVLCLQVFGSYQLIRRVFRWLALVLLAYVGAALMARPNAMEVLKGTFIPHVAFTREFLSMIVAALGASLSAYLFTWQTNVEVEEEIAAGRTTLEQRIGATDTELRRTRRDTLVGMIFSNLVMYFVILATGSTLYGHGHGIDSAAQAAEALRPIAGDAAGFLFAAGLVGVGMLAVPVMTVGAAYDTLQAFGRTTSLHARPREAKLFYATIALFTAIAAGFNFLGFNPMKALVWSGIVQGFSTPALLFLIMLMTNDRRVMGERVNSLGANVLGWGSTAILSLAGLALIVAWVRG